MKRETVDPKGALTKGVSFSHAKHFTQQRWGPAGWEAILEKMRPEDREELASVLPMGWYSLALYNRLIHALEDVHGKGDLAMIGELGRYEAEKDLTTIHRIMFRLLNPGTVIVKTTDYWRKFHDTGSWDMKRIGNSELEGVLTGWGVVDRALCRELVGYLSRALELVGAQNVLVEHPECRARGYARCFFRARWGNEGANTVDSSRRP